MNYNQLKGHQGDVQFRKIDVLPTKLTAIENRPLALGEFSGHQHVVTGDVQQFQLSDTMYIVVGENGARLQHVHQKHVSREALKSLAILPIADHVPLMLPAGIYECWIQQEYNPFANALGITAERMRNVKD